MKSQRLALEFGKALPGQEVQYDYDHQAWIVDGVYRCNHPSYMDCHCYGRLHAGETAPNIH